MGDLAASVIELWHQGGFVMPWLVASTLVLWYALGERWLSLQRGDRRPLDKVVDAHLGGGGPPARGIIGTAVVTTLALDAHDRTPGGVTEALAPLYEEVQRHRVLIQAVAATAPLVGLLGTVAGMIETFDALTTMSLYRGSGGIAGGISAALVSTQMGLAVAIPGMLLGRLLDRRQSELETELDTLGELVRQRTGGT